MFVNKDIVRGVALYVDKSFNARECEELNETDFQESVWCTFNDSCDDKILLGCVYRSPNTSTEDNDDNLFSLLKSKVVNKFNKVCIMGDFNFPTIRWDGEWSGDKNSMIIKKLQDAFLVQRVKECTRRRPDQNPSLVDWVLVSEENLISNIVHYDPVGKSDHDILSFQLYVSNLKNEKQSNEVFNLNKGNYDKFRNILKGYDWSILDKMGVEETWNYIKGALQAGMEQCIPKVSTSIKKKRNTPVWLNKKVLNKIKKKHKLFKRYLTTKSGLDYQKYILERNRCNKLIKNARKDYEHNIAKESKKNPKKFWKYINEKLKVNTGISALNKNDNTVASSNSDKAETLNYYFSSVFITENMTDIPRLNECCFSDGASLTEIRVTPIAIKTKLKELNVNKSPGPDLIPPRVLKEVCEEIATPLCLLFNKSIETGILPNDWKKAEVIALFKKGTKSDPGNYRPVSLTCIACKVLESVVRDSIVSHFTNNKLYTECQHGFRKKRSCVTQLLQVMEDITLLLDEGNTVDIIYFDFKKAFDSVPHQRLLVKLAAYGVCGSVLKWIQNFLNDRTQHVRVGSARSASSSVLSGIPQGSILSPILFTIFINDLPDTVSSTCKIFADDTKLYNKSANSDNIQSDIKMLQEWSVKWNLYFNVEKCKVLHLGNNNEECDYEMIMEGKSQKINVCNNEKDLGVFFDKQLSFDYHIQSVVSKANQMLGIIKRCFKYWDKEIFLNLFKTYVRPHLEYANVIWCPFLKRQSVYLENVQRRATKFLKECKDLSYAERLRYLQLHSLKGRRIRGDLIQTYKIVNEIDDLSLSDFFHLPHANITRNSERKFFIKHCKTNRRKFSFSNRVIKYWNSLPTNVKFAPTLNKYKNYLDTLPKLVDLLYDFD